MTKHSGGFDAFFKVECTKEQLDVLQESAAYYRLTDEREKKISAAEILRILLDEWNQTWIETKQSKRIDTSELKIRRRNHAQRQK